LRDGNAALVEHGFISEQQQQAGTKTWHDSEKAMAFGLVLGLTGDQWIALTGILAGAAGAIGGLLFSYFNGRAERIEARTLARHSRLHTQRLDAYAQLAAFLERERLFVERTEPEIGLGEPQPPPEPLDEEEWLSMQGRVAVAGSDAVSDAVGEAHRCAHVFAAAVWHYNAMRDRTQNLYAPGGPREKMDDARRVALDAIDAAERVMRDELADL